MLSNQRILCAMIGLAILSSLGKCLGAQWESSTLPPIGPFSSSCVRALFCNGNISFAGTELGLFRSADNGKNWSINIIDTNGIGNWEQHGSDSVNHPGYRQISAWGILALGNAMLAAHKGSLFKDSLNCGKSWSRIDTNYFQYDILFRFGKSIFSAFDLYNSPEPALLRSNDSARSWEVIDDSGSVPTASWQPTAYMPINLFASNERTIFACFQGQEAWEDPYLSDIYSSHDSGSTWSLTFHDSSCSDYYSCSYIQALAAQGKMVFAGAIGGGIFRSLDSGNSWSPANSGLLNINVTALLFSGSDLYAGTRGGGVFISNDSGNTWKPFNDGLTDSSIFSLGENGNYLFAGTDSAKGRIWRYPLKPVAIRENSSFSPGMCLKVTSYGRPSATATISYTLPSSAHVRLSIYNFSGHLVSILADKPFSAGTHTLQWDTRSVAPGCYMVRLQAGGRVETRIVPVVR